MSFLSFYFAMSELFYTFAPVQTEKAVFIRISREAQELEQEFIYILI